MSIFLQIQQYTQLAEIWFLRILSCLHLVDNSTRTPTSPRLFKLGTCYQAIVNRLKAVYTPLQNISIDETLSHWRGRVSFRQYIPSKRTRYGIKAHVLAESGTGYVYDHRIYIGEEQQNAISVGLSITENIRVVHDAIHSRCGQQVVDRQLLQFP